MTATLRAMDPRFTSVHHGGEGPALVLIHGFTGTWRMWEPVLASLERGHEVLAPTLAGHAGGPSLPEPGEEALLDGLERAMDEAGLDVADIAGNSLGGYLALGLASRGRARSVVALAPAGGWHPDDPGAAAALRHFIDLDAVLKQTRLLVDRLVAEPDGRARATAFLTVRSAHLSAQLVADLLRGAAECPATLPLAQWALQHGWPLDPERVTCPVRFVWGTEDRLIAWPAGAARYREWFPAADWIVLDDVGHCPQLDVPAVAADLIDGFTAGAPITPDL
jgi:pimeloyl-ACP methyl ester carboxylesterase